MSKDILIYETGSGGDLKLLANDLVLTETLYQSIYLALFGGNIKASTKGNELDGELRYDYWGNSLFEATNQSKQFNSETERLLSKVALNSSGRIAIEKAVYQDLKALSEIVDLTVDVLISGLNEVTIQIMVRPLENAQEKRLQFIFDNSKNELLMQHQI